MTSPSQSVRVKTTAPVKKAAPRQREKKNIFGHMADALGMSVVKTARGQIPLLDKIKKIVLGLSVYMAIGYIIGMIADMFLKSSWSLATVFALVMLLVWILKNGKGYLK